MEPITEDKPVPLSLDDAVDKTLRENPMFKVGTARIRGVEYRVFENVPSNLRSMLWASREAHINQSEYLIFEDERTSYDAYLQNVEDLAIGLQKQFGIGRGARVALAMANSPELLVVMMAVVSLGGVVVFLNAWWTTQELDYALNDSEATIVFADLPRLKRLCPLKNQLGLQIVGIRDAEQHAPLKYSDLIARSHETPAWPEIEPDDDFAVMYSSGTTGHPKGVVLTHRGAISTIYTWIMHFTVSGLVEPASPDVSARPAPCGLVATPLFHVSATHAAFLLSIPVGARLVIMSKWDPDVAVRLIEREQVTRMLGVPAQSFDLLEAAQRAGSALSSLDYLGSGGAKRPPAQVATLATTFPRANIATGWGMTETNANGIGWLGQDYVENPAAAGRLFPPLQDLCILGENGEEVPIGKIGEITVKSPSNMREYLNKPSETKDALTNGWLRTGDLGFVDRHGIITIVDRKKNIIIRGGENIACLDVEAALHQHKAVIEACVFAIPDPRLGEVVGAALQTRMTLSIEDIRSFLQGRIAHFKIPEHFWLQTAPLPRAATDKLDRQRVRLTCLETLAQ